jgi:hypothetical protein
MDRITGTKCQRIITRIHSITFSKMRAKCITITIIHWTRLILAISIKNKVMDLAMECLNSILQWCQGLKTKTSITWEIKHMQGITTQYQMFSKTITTPHILSNLENTEITLTGTN